jgi:hypothetical protein
MEGLVLERREDCRGSSSEEKEEKEVDMQESVHSECQLALWHNPHINSELSLDPTTYCPLDDYKPRGVLPPVLAKWIDKEGSKPVLDEAHTLSEELQVHFNNYSIIKKSA